MFLKVAGVSGIKVILSYIFVWSPVCRMLFYEMLALWFYLTRLIPLGKSRYGSCFGLIVYYRVSSIEYPFQKHAKKSKDILRFGTGKPFILCYMTAVKWFLGLLSWGCSLTQPTVESNFNHWRWTFCLLRQFADFQQTLVLFFLDELLYAAFRSPLPYFLTFKKKYYDRISIVMPAIIEFIWRWSSLISFLISLPKFWKENVKLCLISQKEQCFVREIDTNKKI